MTIVKSLLAATALTLSSLTLAAQTADPTELAFWDTVKTSENAEMLQLYLENYPEGAFAGLAKIMISQLGGAPAEPKAAADESATDEAASRAEPSQSAAMLEKAMRNCDALVGDVESYLRKDAYLPVFDLSDADLRKALSSCSMAGLTEQPSAYFKHFMAYYALLDREERGLSNEEWSVLQKAADADFPAAIVWAGRLYLHTYAGGAEQSFLNEGLAILERGVALKQEYAAFELGQFHSGAEPYYSDAEVPYHVDNPTEDYGKALQYFAKAESFGSATEAAFEQGALYGDLTLDIRDADAAVAAYERSIARGQRLADSHGRRSGFLTIPALSSARIDVPQDIMGFLSEPDFASGVQAAMTAAELGWEEGEAFWSTRALEMLQKLLFVISDAQAINYENNFLAWRGSEDNTNVIGFLKAIADTIESEMVTRFEQNHHGESGEDAETMRAWREAFDRLMDDRVYAFTELNEVTGWDFDFRSADDCIKWVNEEWISVRVFEVEVFNECPADVSFAMVVDQVSHSGKIHKHEKRIELPTWGEETLRFSAPFDAKTANYNWRACYSVQGEIVSYDDGDALFCEGADPTEAQDLVGNYIGRRDALKRHVKELLDWELEQF
ncbi:hypothetical protein [Shimia sp. R9_3]|uniref:hypothetical protein n=1 Tax=Shimia sp. R9_3 TaxID=2821113 RepID=UPI001ADD04F9|nr:hypothetical protein [Shimia sp. R9_3]MBO9402151.1 hypothetical protein [Shimia sp. R9_3]